MERNHRTEALDHLAAVQATEQYLRELYDGPDHHGRDKRAAEAHHLIRSGHAVAKVHSQLAIAQAITQLAEQLGAHQSATELQVQLDPGSLASQAALTEYLAGRPSSEVHA